MTTIPKPHPLPEAPEGYVIEWSERDNLDWRLASKDEAEKRVCRGTRGCPGRVVAALDRSHGLRPSWWFYCDQHLYGRKIRDGKIIHWRWKRVAP